MTFAPVTSFGASVSPTHAPWPFNGGRRFLCVSVGKGEQLQRQSVVYPFPNQPEHFP